MKPSLSRILRASIYSALTILVIILTIVLVAVGRGYIFDFKTGQVEGGGLILLDSEPGGAQVFLDSEDLGKTTPHRLNLKTGNYAVELHKNGYRTWQKQIPVVSSEVSWAQYPLLIPQELKVEPVAQLARPVLLAQSPNGKFVAITVSSPTPRVLTLEVGAKELRSIFTLTAEQALAGINIEKLTWSSDSEHLLLNLTNPTGPSHMLVSVLNPAENIDLTTDFGTHFNNLQFSSQNWRELYWLSGEGLRRLDVANRTISAVLATEVSQFIVSEEAIYYLQSVAGTSQLVRLDRNNNSRILASNLVQSDYRLAYSLFEDRAVVVLADATHNLLRLFDSRAENQSIANPLEKLPATNLVMSPDRRYLAMYSGASFATYDFEFKRIYKFELGSDKFTAPTWLSNYHLLTTVDGTLQILDFDGANRQSLVKSLADSSVFGSRNRELVYSFDVTSSPNNFQLNLVRLRP